MDNRREPTESQSPLKKWAYRSLLAAAILASAFLVFFIGFGVWLYTMPNRTMRHAELLRDQGKYKESMAALQKAMRESMNLNRQYLIQGEISEKFVSSEYYDFWKDLFVSGSINKHRWPPYYAYMQQIFSYRAMIKCRKKAAIEFGLIYLNDPATPEFVHRSLERTMQQSKDQR